MKLALARGQTSTLYNGPVVLKSMCFPGFIRDIPFLFHCCQHLQMFANRQTLAVSVDGKPTDSEVPLCQDSSIWHYSILPQHLRGTLGSLSSLVNKEDNAETQNM